MLSSPNHGSTLFHHASPHKSLDDDTLWQNFRKGNDLALSLLYRRHVQLLYNYGMHGCGRHDLVIDCIQGLFRELAEHRHRVERTGSVQFFFLCSIRQRIALKIDLPGKFFSSYQVGDEKISAKHPGKRAVPVTSNCFKSLSRRQREVFFLRFSCRLSYYEIASVLCLSIGSVHNLTAKALDVMKELLPSQ